MARVVLCAWALTDGIAQDVRFAIRVLLKHRTSTAVTLMLLALGLGVNTAVFTAAHAWVVSPYPYPQPERLVMLQAVHVKGNTGAHYRDFLDWRARNRVFEEIAIFLSSSTRVLATGAEPERVVCMVTTAGADRVLDVRPVVGRFFTEQEDAPAGPDVALVAHSTWQRRFGARPDIIGTIAMLDGRPHTIIGVMPDHAALPHRTRPAFWLPLRANPATRNGQQYYELMARLKQDVTLEQARAHMTEVALALEREDPASNQGWRITVTPAQSLARARARTVIVLLFTIAGCVLLLVCANVAGVLLVRSALRTKELAVRAALGAGRWRLVQQVLVEGVLLGTAGGLLGLLVADWTLSIADAFVPNRGIATLLAIEGPLVLFTATVSLLTGILFGLWPAFRISKVDLDSILKGSGFLSDRGESRTRLLSGLVVVEIALAMALLVAGGLLTKDLSSLVRVDTGVNPEGVVTFMLRAPRSRYRSEEQQAAFVAEVLDRLRTGRGVENAAAVGSLPLGGDKVGVQFDVGSGWQDPSTPSSRGILNATSPGYFRVVGIRLLQGRDFDERDRLGAPPVAIVSQRLAERHARDENVLGERLYLYGRSYTIVGVVGTVRHDGPAYEAYPEIYLPIAQSPRAVMSFVVRGAGGSAHLLAESREGVRRFDPQLPVERLRTMEQVIHDSLRQSRLSAEVLTGFALFGLVLALTGLYGLIAFSTQQRTREIAIRVSLGASSIQVLRWVMWHGARLAAAGLALGVPLALAVAQVMKSVLTSTSPTDTAVLTLVPLVVIAAALAATYIPARRATRIEPTVALRSE